MKKVSEMNLFRWGTIILVIISCIIAIVFTIYGFANLGSEADDMLVTYVISFISFVVSTVALAVALRTYFSIDAVNSITSMEGNVLQNEKYSVSYPELIN